jgi:hypothetical protein
VEVAVADRPPQSCDDVEHVVVRSLDVHGHPLAPEGDIAGILPLAQVTGALSEVTVRLQAHAECVIDGAEHYVARQLKRSWNRRLAESAEETLDEVRQLAPVHGLRTVAVLDAQAPDVDQVTARGDGAAVLTGDEYPHQAGVGVLSSVDARPLVLSLHGQAGGPMIGYPASDECRFALGGIGAEDSDERRQVGWLNA